MNSSPTGKTETLLTVFPHEVLLEALLTLNDALGGCSIPYMVFRNTGKQMYYGEKLSGSEISIGIMLKNYSESTIPLLKTVRPDYIDNGNHLLWYETVNTAQGPANNLQITFHKVPIYAKIITRNYWFFKNPNPRVYEFESFSFPNPWEEYWISRGIIR